MIEFHLNGQLVRVDSPVNWSLLRFLREQRWWGTKHGCEGGECGACAVLVDGRAVPSCLTLAHSVHGKRVETVEGLGEPGDLHPLQEAFIDVGAIQCGYCTPGMLMASLELLRRIPDPTEADVRDALTGTLCRCTGYVKPVEAVLLAAQKMQEDPS